MTDPNEQRRAVVDGLRELADFVETHPKMPVDLTSWAIQYSVIKNTFPTEADGHAEVDRVADLLGVEATTLHDGEWYMAARSFGAIEYKAIRIRPKAEQDDQAAEVDDEQDDTESEAA